MKASERLITFGHIVLPVKQLITCTDITEVIDSASYHCYSAYEKNKRFYWWGRKGQYTPPYCRKLFTHRQTSQKP